MRAFLCARMTLVGHAGGWVAAHVKMMQTGGAADVKLAG